MELWSRASNAGHDYMTQEKWLKHDKKIRHDIKDNINMTQIHEFVKIVCIKRNVSKFI